MNRADRVWKAAEAVEAQAPTTTPDGWVEGRYNHHYRALGHGLQITIGWDSTASFSSETGYKVSFAGATLKARIRSLDEAKAAGLKLAKRMLEDALAALPKEN